MQRFAVLAFFSFAALGAATASAETVITGGNVTNQTWVPSGSPYIIQGDITVPPAAFLTIQAGVEVRMETGDSQGSGENTSRVEIIINGILDVQGTTAAPVVFRAASGSSGGWHGIIANAAATQVKIRNANVEQAIVGITNHGSALDFDRVSVISPSSIGVLLRAGSPTVNGIEVSGAGSSGISVAETASPTLVNCVSRNNVHGVSIAHNSPGRSVTIDHCTLNANSSTGVRAVASFANSATITVTNSIVANSATGLLRTDGAAFSVTHTNVWNNTTNFNNVSPGAGAISSNPLYVSATDMRLTSNSPSRFGASNSTDQGGRPFDGVSTAGLHGVLWSNTTLTAAASPHLVDGDLTVGPGVTVTIEPGAQLSFAPGDVMLAGQSTSAGELTVRGRLMADGRVATPIIIDSSSSSSGSWFGIDFDATAHDSVLDNIIVRRAINGFVYRSLGDGNSLSRITVEAPTSVGFLLRAGSPILGGIEVSGAGSSGISVTETASPTIFNCVSRNNVHGVSIAHNSPGRSVTLINCTINANSSTGVRAVASFANSATITVTNSIVTNSATGLLRTDGAAFSVTHSNVWNNTTNFNNVSPGTGVISSNPLYVSTTDMRLTSNSPSRFGANNGVDQGGRPFDGVPTVGLHGVLWSNTTLTAAGSPHLADGDLTVGPGVTVTIEPGALITFSAGDVMFAGENPGRSELTVRGRLIADGTPTAPIVVTATSTVNGSWFGIDLDATAHDSVLDNIILTRAITGVLYRSLGDGNALSRITVDAPTSVGFLLRAGNPTLDGIAVNNAGSSGISVADTASPTLVNCVSRNNVHGVSIAHNSPGRSVTLLNCSINANSSTGVRAVASFANSATITVTNSIVTNSATGLLRTDGAAFSVTHSDVWNNTTNFNNVSPGTGVISANPQYVSATDLRLQSSSVAIDVGTTGPTSDADGITRPLDGDGVGGTQWDLGAYEFVLAAQCGNGALETNEVCDSGILNGTYGNCNATCTAQGERCGDGVKNGPETCDDGNDSDTDECLTTCVAARCGDGIIRAGVETCDDGNDSNTDECPTTCQDAFCGDGFKRPSEECDDGNNANTDACLTSCKDAFCGDGFTNPEKEECDDANGSNEDGCLNTCKAAICGDGLVNPDKEQCDDGNAIDTDACVACANAVCGDGFLEAGSDEACDDGNDVDTDQCSNACERTSCGDGTVQSGEGCDDGNAIDTDACRYDCTVATCGDGVVRAGVETCDDGNLIAGDGCSPACQADSMIPPPPVDPDVDHDGGGCCQSSEGAPLGGLLLTAMVLLGLRRRRRA